MTRHGCIINVNGYDPIIERVNKPPDDKARLYYTNKTHKCFFSFIGNRCEIINVKVHVRYIDNYCGKMKIERKGKAISLFSILFLKSIGSERTDKPRRYRLSYWVSA